MYRRLLYACITLGHMLLVTGKRCPAPCSCHKDVVNCSGKKLERIPKNLPPSTKTLLLGHNRIQDIKKSDFCVLKYLVELQLQNNKIESVLSDTFTGACIPNIQTIRLENNNINVTGESAFYNLSVLVNTTLTNNKLVQMHPNTFRGTSLKFLHLGSNHLTTIPNLQGLSGLNNIVLEGNKIQNCTFPSEFATMSNLTTIGMSKNKIQELSKDAFIGLKHGKSLTIGWNPLTDTELYNALSGLVNTPLSSLSISSVQLNGLIPSLSLKVLEAVNLSTLGMSFNEINNIPSEGFKTLTKLNILDLSNCGIRYIHENAFIGLKNLNNLQLSNNYIQSVPKNIPKNLLYLYMTGNQVNVLRNNSFSDLRSLRRLHLGNNKILTLFGEAFLGLNKLEELQLYGNRINTLPSRLFAPFTRLIQLELQQNKLKTIQNSTKTFASMTSLKYLNLADNGCSSLPSTLFSNLKSLQTLHLRGNQLGKYLLNDVGGHLFLGLKKLEFLDISSNQIHSFPSNIFIDTRNLHTLLLQDNWISGWGASLFSNSISLSSLDLSNNMITIINEGNMKNLGSLESVNVTNNPFACTCDLRWFRRWIKNTKIKVINVKKYKCNSPAEWKGKLLISFDETKIECSLVSVSVAVGISSGVLVESIVSAFIIYQNRFNIIYLRYRMKKWFARKHGGYEEIRNKEYDACLIYSESSDEDKEWIETNFLPDFDRGKENDDYHGEYKIYYQERDTLGNASTLETLMDVMEKSRKIILVVTKNFRLYPLAHILITVALWLQGDSIDDIIIVTVGEISFADVPRLLHFKCVGDQVEWKHNNINCNRVFKEKMKEELGNPLRDFDTEMHSPVE
ncbi:slit homolog 1 protein-like isoform X2 [Saccostrea cucullata]|uniref:slit homolog 1 protein-like isoform X2 n=1 Tax=Saccostrea cuccullata TaxID=36930 RepID=UPI002ED04BFB